MIAIFNSKLELEQIELPSGTIIGTPLEFQDGRIAIVHPFSKDDIDYLQNKSILATELQDDMLLLPE